jgi:SAM-dependent methyltransferase
LRAYRDYEAFWSDPLLDASTPNHSVVQDQLRGPVVVDLGCGSAQAALRRPDLFWIGLDGSITALSAARHRIGAMVRADLAEAIPLRSGTIEESVCLDVLEHLADPRPLLRELARVLHPAGRVWLSTPNPQYLKHVIRLLGGRMLYTSDASTLFRGGHLQDYTALDVVALTEEVGLSVTQICPVYASRLATIQRRTRLPLAFQKYTATAFLYRVEKRP